MNKYDRSAYRAFGIQVKDESIQLIKDIKITYVASKWDRYTHVTPKVIYREA